MDIKIIMITTHKMFTAYTVVSNNIGKESGMTSSEYTRLNFL